MGKNPIPISPQYGIGPFLLAKNNAISQEPKKCVSERPHVKTMYGNYNDSNKTSVVSDKVAMPHLGKASDSKLFIALNLTK